MISRRRPETTISSHVFSDEEILGMEFTARYFTIECGKDPKKVLKWLASLGLIKNSRLCEFGHTMRLVSAKKRSSGFRWECKKPCRKSKSVCADSIFEDSALSFEQVMLLIYHWATDKPQKDIVSETEVCADSVSDWCEFFRDVVAEHLVDFSDNIGRVDADLVPIDVEIDESQFFKRKSNKGRMGNPIWVFGGIERGTRRAFIVPVENRSRDTLMGIILRRIAVGSRIISDQWASYRSLYNGYIYDHAEVNHSVNFVDPEDRSVHSQNVECMWCHAKNKLSVQHGTSRRLLAGYMIEFTFRYYHSREKEKIFNIFLNTLRRLPD